MHMSQLKTSEKLRQVCPRYTVSITDLHNYVDLIGKHMTPWARVHKLQRLDFLGE